MLLQYYGFKEEPFGVTPDPRCIYPSATHSEALASLKYGFLSNRGFIALIAPPGMGKTTILCRFLEDIRGIARSVFLFDIGPECEPQEIIGFILRDLGIVPGGDRVSMHEQLNTALHAEFLAGSSVVLVIDEAQNLSDAALETVRILTNFETSRAKLMQVVLAGQPQLSDKLMKPSLAQLRQRISTICHVEHLSPQQTRAYIDHRLRFGGYAGLPLFSSDAIRRITDASHGVPRVINSLCFNSLALCFAMQRKQVDGGMVVEVINDRQLRPRWTWTTRLNWSKALSVVALLLVSLVGGLKFGERARIRSRQGDNPQTSHNTKPPVSVESSFLVPVDKPVGKMTSMVGKPFAIIVKRDQTLARISLDYLGKFNSESALQILELNPQLTDVDHILEGQKLWLPGR